MAWLAFKIRAKGPTGHKTEIYRTTKLVYSRYLPNLPLFGNFSISFPFSLGSGIIEWKKRFQNRKIEFSRLIWQLQSCLFPVRKIWQSTTELIFIQTTTWCCFLPVLNWPTNPRNSPEDSIRGVQHRLNRCPSEGKTAILTHLRGK